jgi:glycosyltransferase involved in cell wall biosynthesis
MHLLAITVGDKTVGSTRIRFLNYLPYLHEAGWTTTIHEFVSRSRSQRLIEIFKLAWLASRSDVVLLQKRLFPIWAVRLIRQNTRHLVFEVDDPIFLSESTGKIVPTADIRFTAQLRMADAIIVDNPALAAYCQQFNPSVNVIVSCVDTSVFKPSDAMSDDDRFVIGWVGQSSTLPFLDEIEQPLAELYKQYKDHFVFKVVSAKPYTSKYFPVMNKVWRLEEEPDDVRSFSVGIVPLREFFWTKYKMAYRPYLYMACGVPVVLSSIGPSLNVLEHGKEGFFARTQEDWFNSLKMLIDNQALCQQMGQYGVQRVREGFSYERNFPKLLQVLKP